LLHKTYKNITNLCYKRNINVTSVKKMIQKWSFLKILEKKSTSMVDYSIKTS
jgi:hypothetical protein